VGIVTRIRPGRSGVRISAEARDCFSSIKRSDRLWGHLLGGGSQGGLVWGKATGASS